MVLLVWMCTQAEFTVRRGKRGFNTTSFRKTLEKNIICLCWLHFSLTDPQLGRDCSSSTVVKDMISCYRTGIGHDKHVKVTKTISCISKGYPVDVDNRQTPGTVSNSSA